jgi:hypothetical protein
VDVAIVAGEKSQGFSDDEDELHGHPVKQPSSDSKHGPLLPCFFLGD